MAQPQQLCECLVAIDNACESKALLLQQVSVIHCNKSTDVHLMSCHTRPDDEVWVQMEPLKAALVCTAQQL